MTPKKYTIPAHVKGDTFMNGVGLVFVVTTGTGHAPLDLTAYKIRCQFRFGSKTGALALTATETNGIEIHDTNQFTLLESKIIDWTPGVYYYDIEFKDGSGVINTYIEGTFTILQDVTIPNG